MVRSEAFELIKRLYPLIYTRSGDRFLYPPGMRTSPTIPSYEVFDAIRETMEGGLSKEEFNDFLDKVDRGEA
jgi:hypothetical protein